MARKDLYNDLANEAELSLGISAYECEDLLNSTIDRIQDEINLLMSEEEDEQVIDEDPWAWWREYQDEKIEQRWAEENERWERSKVDDNW